MAIATKDKNNGRQWALVGRQVFDFSEMEDAVAVEALDLPINAVVTGGQLVITEVFNSATSDTITVSGGGASTAAVDVTATGSTALTLDGTVNTLGDTVDLTWDGTGAVPTTGAGFLIVEYIITGRANENQP